MGRYLKKKCNVKLGARGGRKLLKGRGFGREQLIFQYVHAREEGVGKFRRGLKLVFSNERGFQLHPKVGLVWAQRGTQPVVPTTSQHHRRFNLFGCVEALYG